MLVSIDKTYKTKCGCDVKIYAIHEDQYIIHGAYFEGGSWTQASWKLDGTHLYPNRVLNLVEVKRRIKRTYWVNLYQNIDYVMAYSSKEKADYAASPDRIACVKREIDFEEGEGL